MMYRVKQQQERKWLSTGCKRNCQIKLDRLEIEKNTSVLFPWHGSVMYNEVQTHIWKHVLAKRTSIYFTEAYMALEKDLSQDQTIALQLKR